MSDTHTVVNTPAPAVSTSTPAAPPASEVPVNPPQGSSPAPLGSQAPPKPEGQESNKSSHVSRREAIQNAFARAKQNQDEAAKAQPQRRAQAPTREEGVRGPQRSAEGEQPTAQRQPQHREGGRFARDPSKPPPEPGQEQTPPGQQRQQYQPLAPDAKFREAPPRFDAQAKADWAGAPESVRGAVDRMTRDFQGAYEKYRGDYEVMETLRPYHNLATKQGTTLERAFTNYYQMEQKLRQDVVGGLDVIVQNLRMQHADGTPVTMRDVAYHILNMSPEQQRLSSQQNQQTAADMRIGQLHQIVERQSKQLEQLVYHQRFKDTRSEVDDFAKTHPRLDELGLVIKQELDHGYSLPVAYERANRLYPPTQAAQTRNATAQTRRTSISGAPDGGRPSPSPSDGRRKANGEAVQHPTRREAIAKAMRRVNGGI